MGRFRRTPEDTAPEPGLAAIEDALRRYRPAAPTELVRAIAGPPVVRADNRRPRLAFAGVLTVLLALALSAVGGVSYAANAVTHAARQVLVTHVHVVGKGITAGGDQYKPGYGFGDPNHQHEGPPGFGKGGSGGGGETGGGSGGPKAPPSQVKPAVDRRAFLVAASITLDEQAALYFSVLDANGTQLLLTQRGSTIGGAVEGPQVKTIHYVMLVPRTVRLQIRVPANLLRAGQTYRVRIIAVDAQGNKARTEIPFTA